MKYPTYLTEYELKKTAELFHTIRQRFGLSQALIFKRMSLTAAYGSMYAWKIDYGEFLNIVIRYLDKPKILSFDGFWNLKGEADRNLHAYYDYEVYHVRKEHIVYDSMRDFEKNLIDTIMDTNPNHFEDKRIKRAYKAPIKAMFPNILLEKD